MITATEGIRTRRAGAESGALSSFAITAGGITPITRSVRHHSGTSCWVLTEPQQRRFAYASNNNTNDISIFAVASDGIHPRHPDAEADGHAHEAHADGADHDHDDAEDSVPMV